MTGDDGAANAFESTRSGGVLRVSRPGTEWLHTGWDGGRRVADAAYNVSVPEGWRCEELAPYLADRLAAAGFDEPGPTLLTGVGLQHARGARCGPVTAFATAGLSNPAALPSEPSGGALPDGRLVAAGSSEAEPRTATEDGDRGDSVADPRDDPRPPGAGSPDDPRPPGAGTINVIVGTDRALAGGALANLVAVAAEAKAATTLAATGFPGTTTDAVTVGHDPDGPPVEFSGSATRVGAATRACVREAVAASLGSRYAGEDSIPKSVADARYGVSTDVRADVFRPGE
ncbi:adenosylcobinamide amidohydrolase [Halovivax sp.]|uniref:adenosylcobinamide amidohydrolase n=1 Tax=Halovivax sp. TaxID=1935978 RepID=UPI0025C52186|nr:adenosylcobinamide amidohydrolase [Halovivax sp.]